MSDEAKIVSVIGGCRRQNRWRVAEDTSVMTLFGRCYLDLREAESDAELIEINVLNVFANITIIVPEGCDVRPSGTALLGSSSCHVPVSDKASPLPPIEIDGMTVFGRLRVATIDQIPPKKKRFWHRSPDSDVAPESSQEVSTPHTAQEAVAATETNAAFAAIEVANSSEEIQDTLDMPPVATQAEAPVVAAENVNQAAEPPPAPQTEPAAV